jgi:hypothetical protein
VVDCGVKVFFVTHLYDFAYSFRHKMMKNAIFLRAERRSDGARTFRIVEGEPSQSSYGKDLYERVFGSERSPGGARGSPQMAPLSA